MASVMSEFEVSLYPIMNDIVKLLIEKNHDIFSKGDLDIGLGNNFNHRNSLEKQ